MSVIFSLLRFHLAAHATPTTRPSPTAPTSSSAGDISGLESALIGVGGAIIGGALGGWFGLLAAGPQSKRERAESRKERSRQAAMDIADAWPVLEEALLAAQPLPLPHPSWTRHTTSSPGPRPRRASRSGTLSCGDASGTT